MGFANRIQKIIQNQLGISPHEQGCLPKSHHALFISIPIKAVLNQPIDFSQHPLCFFRLVVEEKDVSTY